MLKALASTGRVIKKGCGWWKVPNQILLPSEDQKMHPDSDGWVMAI